MLQNLPLGRILPVLEEKIMKNKIMQLAEQFMLLRKGLSMFS
jgi:hypothetical protein